MGWFLKRLPDILDMICRMYSGTGTTGGGAQCNASLSFLIGRLWSPAESHEGASTTYIGAEFDGEFKNRIIIVKKNQKIFKNTFEEP